MVYVTAIYFTWMHGIINTSVVIQFHFWLVAISCPPFRYARSAGSFFAVNTTSSLRPRALVQVPKMSPAYPACEDIFLIDCSNSLAFRDLFARSVSYIKKLVQ